ncbi:hypothetical protein CPB85DRAFT_1258644 [Mucidula mucida]|nr:hypothetical protein CPB85DRAFT_1258644 [Mucidula mucida]
MPPNTTEFWIGLPPFLFLVKGGSRPTYYAETHTTLVDLARLYTDGPSIAVGETIEHKTFRANVHRLQQGRPFTMQRSDTREMQAAAERSMRERYRSASPARSYIMISSDEEEDDGAQEPGGRVYRTPYTGKREPTPEVELLAKPSPTPARRTNARTLRNQARVPSKQNQAITFSPPLPPILPFLTRVEFPNKELPLRCREVEVLLPASAKTLVGAGKRNTTGPVNVLNQKLPSHRRLLIRLRLLIP